MGKLSRSVGTIVALGVVLTVANRGGIAGCGGGEETGGPGGTVEQQQQALFTFKSATDVGTQLQIQLLGLGALTLQLSNKDQTVTPCPVGGSYMTEVSATSLTLTFENCDLGCEVVNGVVPFDLVTGTTSFNLPITPDAGDPFTLTGTSVFVDPNLTFDLTGASTSTGVCQITGAVTVNSLDGTATGTLNMTCGDETITTCVLDGFNFLTSTIDDFAAICGLSSPTCS
jgi:hypothetical protein